MHLKKHIKTKIKCLSIKSPDEPQMVSDVEAR